MSKADTVDAIYLEKFIDAYIAAALWASTDDDGQPLDKRFVRADIGVDSIKSMRDDCGDFVLAQWGRLQEAQEEHNYGPDKAGHDFWLTRNQHGCGYWERGLGGLGQALTEASHSYGGCDLYVGDDRKVHCA